MSIFFRKNLNITLIFAQYVMATLIFFSMLLACRTFLQSVLGAGSGAAGITMLSLSVMAMMMTPIATRGWNKRVFVCLWRSAGSSASSVFSCCFAIRDHSVILAVGAVLAVFGISNGIQNIGLQNLLYSFIDRAESGIAAGLLITSRFIGNILASSIYGVSFATGMNAENLQKMTMVLFIVALVTIPGLMYVTRHEKKGKAAHDRA